MKASTQLNHHLKRVRRWGETVHRPGLAKSRACALLATKAEDLVLAVRAEEKQQEKSS